MATGIEGVLEVIQARIDELESNDELRRLKAARFQLTGEEEQEIAPARQTVAEAAKAEEKWVAARARLEKRIADQVEEIDALKEQKAALKKALEELRAAAQHGSDEAVAEIIAERDQANEALAKLRAEYANLESTLDQATRPSEPATKKVEKTKPVSRPNNSNTEEQPPFAADILAALRKSFKAGEEFSLSDAVKGVQRTIPGVNQYKVKDRMVQLRDTGELYHNGKTARGSKWKITGKAEPAGEADDKPSSGGAAKLPKALNESDLRKVKGWVVDQADTFSPQQAANATKLTRDQATQYLELLVGMGLVQDESPAPDMRLFSYIKGSNVSASVNGPTKRGAPVAGTGGGPKVRNKALQGLLDSCIKAGAKVKKAGNGHFEIKSPDGARVLVSSTPSNDRTVLNDRTRVRRIGLAV